MAMMDDKNFLLSHIRNSFITSDDTGMCEIIIESEDASERPRSGTEKRPTTWPSQCGEANGNLVDSGLETDTELTHSYDILPDMDFAGHRRRSNTAQKLEKLKREKHKQSKIKHIQWRDSQCTVDEIGEYFVKKDISLKEKPPAKSMSTLSTMLDSFAAVPHNPFLEYAKFDGRSSVGLATKKIDIFLTMTSPADQPYPMKVVTLAQAKVLDLVGLICWQYTMEGRYPPLCENVEAFALHIAEDDGEADMDFPALDSKEPMSKFGFHKLALVLKDIPASKPKADTAIIITHAVKGATTLAIEDTSITMKEVLHMVLQKNGLQSRTGLEYQLEKQNEPGVAVDLEASLSDMATHHFVLLRENSVREGLEVEELPTKVSEMAESLSSHTYMSYIVSLLHKLRTNKEVQLGISGDKVEIDPLSGKGLLFKQKAVTYNMYEHIAACNVIDERSSTKATFRLVYREEKNKEFKHHDFECEASVARSIVTKVNNIIDMRTSPVRKDYVAYREKKLQKRHTLGL